MKIVLAALLLIGALGSAYFDAAGGCPRPIRGYGYQQVGCGEAATGCTPAPCQGAVTYPVVTTPAVPPGIIYPPCSPPFPGNPDCSGPYVGGNNIIGGGCVD